MMNDLFARFVDWKKNIVLFDCHALSVQLSTARCTIDSIKDQMLVSQTHIQEKELSKRIKHSEWRVEKDEYGEVHSITRDQPMAPEVNVYPNVTLFKEQVSFQLLDRLGLVVTLEKIASPFIQQILALPGLLLATHCNPHYGKWENNIIPGAYKYRGGLKVYHDPKLDAKAVDLSKRPGRIAATGDWRFVGASDYWFGPAIFEVFPREHLLAFKQGLSIQELPNGIIHLQLLHLGEYWSDDSQARIKALREHLEIDRLEREYRTALRDLWEQRHGKPGKGIE